MGESVFSANLRNLRTLKGLSQEQLGFLADLHRTEISLLERGRRQPSYLTIEKVSKALGVDPIKLIGLNHLPHGEMSPEFKSLKHFEIIYDAKGLIKKASEQAKLFFPIDLIRSLKHFLPEFSLTQAKRRIFFRKYNMGDSEMVIRWEVYPIFKNYKKTSYKLYGYDLTAIYKKLRDCPFLYSKDVGLGFISQTHEILSLNSIIISLWGWTDINNVIGRKCFEVFHQSTEQCSECQLEQIVNSCQSSIKNNPLRSLDNLLAGPCNWSLYPVQGEKNSVVAIELRY